MSKIATCENCRYEYEDMEGTHCRHCIHNAEECFEPKILDEIEYKIRAKAIKETTLAIYNHILSETELTITVDDWVALSEEFLKVAERLLKAGGNHE